MWFLTTQAVEINAIREFFCSLHQPVFTQIVQVVSVGCQTIERFCLYVISTLLINLIPRSLVFLALSNIVAVVINLFHSESGRRVFAKKSAASTDTKDDERQRSQHNIFQ